MCGGCSCAEAHGVRVVIGGNGSDGGKVVI